MRRPPGIAPFDQDRAHLDQLAEKQEVGVALDESLPPDSSTVAVVVEGMNIVRVESVNQMSTAIDKGDGRDVRSS